MGSKGAPGRIGLLSLVAAMAYGLFVLAPLVIWGLVWPPAFVVVLVAAIGAVLFLDVARRRDRGVAATRIGVRRDRFAELVKAAGLPCPRCGYDLAGAENDRCPEYGEQLELVVRTQLHYEFVESVGPGISDRDMRGLAAPAVRWCGVAVLLPAIVTMVGIIMHKATSKGTPAVFAGGCLAYMLFVVFRWWRRKFDEDLPRERTEALFSTAGIAAVAVLVSLADLAF